jgi:predicted ferric reductase
MGNILYIVAVVLVIIWAIGFLGYNSGGIIHILLVIALISILLRLISGNKRI